MSHDFETTWSGLRSTARELLETRDYSKGSPLERLSSTGLPGGELVSRRDELADGWIPGVEVFPRQVYQQKGRGYFAELTRLNQGKLDELGLAPRQWASALMHRDSAKGFHIHPPHIPENYDPASWFQELYGSDPASYEKRNYHLEQWDVMFFLTSLCEFFLVDEREGMPRKKMRFTIAGDSHPGDDNVAIVIPPGVSHALVNIGHDDLIMVYGTSTTFEPAWEGRIESGIEQCNPPTAWQKYFAQS